MIAAIDTPSVDWLALSPTIALLVAAGVALLSALLPEWMRKGVSATAALAGFVVATGLAVYLFDESATPEVLLDGSMTRDQLAAMAQAILGVDRRDGRPGVLGRAASHESRRVLRPARDRRVPGWRSS